MVRSPVNLHYHQKSRQTIWPGSTRQVQVTLALDLKWNAWNKQRYTKYGLQNFVKSDNYNGFFFNPKTATNRRISTRAGSTLKDTEMKELLKQNY